MQKFLVVQVELITLNGLPDLTKTVWTSRFKQWAFATQITSPTNWDFAKAYCVPPSNI